MFPSRSIALFVFLIAAVALYAIGFPAWVAFALLATAIAHDAFAAPADEDRPR